MIRYLLAFAMFVFWLSAQPAAAHPDDEFCTNPTDRICQALARADSTSTPVGADISVQYVERIDQDAWTSFANFLPIGFEHILPAGLDHILFVVAIAIGAARWLPLLLQISAFTLAHTLTLGLASLGWISAPGSIVEPLIALSIAWVAVENIWLDAGGRWRTLVIFGFGLFHGLGFAGQFAGLDIPPGDLLPALAGFNIGVEIGQLVIVAAVLAVAWPLRALAQQKGRSDLYRHALVWPVSLAIAAMGIWWAVTRIAGSFAV